LSDGSTIYNLAETGTTTGTGVSCISASLAAGQIISEIILGKAVTGGIDAISYIKIKDATGSQILTVGYLPSFSSQQTFTFDDTNEIFVGVYGTMDTMNIWELGLFYYKKDCNCADA
jgi:hypothetical protein